MGSPQRLQAVLPGALDLDGPTEPPHWDEGPFCLSSTCHWVWLPWKGRTLWRGQLSKAWVSPQRGPQSWCGEVGARRFAT